MSFLKKLFEKKPGGTFVGNLIRGVVKTVSGGLAGNGKGILTQQQYDAQHLSDLDYFNKYGTTKDGYTYENDPTKVDIQPVNIGQINTQGQTLGQVVGNYVGNQVVQPVVTSWWKQNLPYIIGGALGLVGMIYLIFKRK